MRRLKDKGLNLTERGSRAFTGRSGMRITVPFLAFAAIGLLVLSRLNHTALTQARWRMAEVVSPVLGAAMVPFEPIRSLGQKFAAQVDLANELERVKSENRKLSTWEWRARDLERKLAELEALSKVVNQPALAFVTARVIAEQSGAFARSIIIDAGTTSRIAVGYPVISADGLIGRVVEAGPTSARVLLVSDQASRIPVVVGRSGIRAMLAGNNGSEPDLEFVTPGAGVKPSDEVATSGVGGLLPRGLRIGEVSAAGNAARVTLRAKLEALDYVSVLLFQDPGAAATGDKAVPLLPRPQAGLDQISPVPPAPATTAPKRSGGAP